MISAEFLIIFVFQNLTKNLKEIENNTNYILMLQSNTIPIFSPQNPLNVFLLQKLLGFDAKFKYSPDYCTIFFQFLTRMKENHDQFNLILFPFLLLLITGAGDAFIGALAFFFSKFPDASLVQKVAASIVIATSSVQNKGTQSSYINFPTIDPTKEEFKYNKL